MVGLGFQPDTIHNYFQQVVKPNMLWRPVGVVLHNTEYPTIKDWPGSVDGQPVTAMERLRLFKHYYAVIRGWPSGPHCFIDTKRVWIFSPPWKPGTGSPSWDADHFQVELVGDYAKEMLPDTVRGAAISTIAAMFAVIGKEPTLQTFRYHKEDKRSRHKRCPGANVGNKDRWIKEVVYQMELDKNS